MRRLDVLLTLMAVTACATAPTRTVVDGVELHYVERGHGEPVVLIHGSLADYTYWEDSDQIAPLAERYRVIAYSRRYNHPNRNEPVGDHSAVVETRDLAGLLDRLGTGPVHLVGHSYGAYTALLFALEHPGRVRSLVLAEPPILPWLPDIPGGAGIMEGFMAEVWEPLGDTFRERGDEAGLDQTALWYFGVPFAEVEPAWRTLFRRNVREWRALALSPVAAFCVYLLVLDLADYWRHRLQHRLRAWWALHSLHHSQRTAQSQARGPRSLAALKLLRHGVFEQPVEREHRGAHAYGAKKGSTRRASRGSWSQDVGHWGLLSTNKGLRT